MARLLTRNIATMTEMREPHKVLARAGGKPVAIMKNSRCVGYFVPIKFIEHSNVKIENIDDLYIALQRHGEEE